MNHASVTKIKLAKIVVLLLITSMSLKIRLLKVSVKGKQSHSLDRISVCVDLWSACCLVALRGQTTARPWASGSPGSHGGMCSDSESAGGSSESRSMDSPTASPGRGI